MPLSVHLLAPPEASPSSLYGLYETLMAAGRDWEHLVTGEAEDPVFNVALVGPSRDPYACNSGLRISADLTYEEARDADLVVVPGLNISHLEPLDADMHPAITWLSGQTGGGTRIVSACTGAVYLAHVGLLDGREATSHWAWEDYFARNFPAVRLRLDRNLCFEDASQGVVTSGGTTGWQELALFLITQYGTAQRAARAAKVWLMADRGELQAPYASMLRTLPHDDQAVASAQSWIAMNYATANPVSEVTARSGLAPSTFARRFRAATGRAPQAYVQAVRIEEARQILETTDLSVADVGAQVGYEDTASFRRLFKRRTGLTPAAHRKMFGKARFARYQ